MSSITSVILLIIPITIITVQVYVLSNTNFPILRACQCIERFLDLLSNYLCDYKVVISY